MKKKTIQLMVSRSVKIITPQSKGIKPRKIWIENIFPASERSGETSPLIIYRIWNKKRDRWTFHVLPFDTLFMYNQHYITLKIDDKEKPTKKD